MNLFKTSGFKNTKRASRDSNIELLRILLTFSIVTHHVMMHGSDLKGMATDSYKITSNTPYIFLLNSFLLVGVDCYIFITGYYGIKFKISSVIRLIWQGIFYSLGFLAVFYLLGWRPVSAKEVVMGLFPATTGVWWFLTTYLFLFLLSPLLNTACNRFTKQQFIYILIVLTILNCVVGFIFDPFGLGTGKGYSLLNFIYIYLLGRYFKKFPETVENVQKYSFAVYFLCSFALFVISMIALHHLKESTTWRLFVHTNPLIMLSAVALFHVFKQFSFRNTFINSVSQYTFGVYLIHDHSFIRENMELLAHRFMNFSSLHLYVITLIIFSFCLLVFCLTVERIRQAFFATPPKLIYKFIDMERYDRIINQNI